MLRSLIRRIYPPRCPGIDELLAEGIAYRFCPSCLERIRPAEKNTPGQKAIYRYEGVMKTSMYRFKYSNRRGYAEAYAADAVRRFGTRLQTEVPPQLIVPIPLYGGKLRLRGYNQAAEFAKALTRLTGIPNDPHFLARIRDTRPQKGLGTAERTNNLKNAFKIQQNSLQLGSILIVDDIRTTGTTLREAEKVLKKMGVTHIESLCICAVE